MKLSKNEISKIFIQLEIDKVESTVKDIIKLNSNLIRWYTSINDLGLYQPTRFRLRDLNLVKTGDIIEHSKDYLRNENIYDFEKLITSIHKLGLHFKDEIDNRILIRRKSYKEYELKEIDKLNKTPIDYLYTTDAVKSILKENNFLTIGDLTKLKYIDILNLENKLEYINCNQIIDSIHTLGLNFSDEIKIIKNYTTDELLELNSLLYTKINKLNLKIRDIINMNSSEFQNNKKLINYIHNLGLFFQDEVNEFINIKKLKETCISDLEFSIKSKSILKENNFILVEDLINIKTTDLDKIKYIDSIIKQDIINLIHSKNLYFKDETNPNRNYIETVLY